MFDIGFWELALVAVIALIVLGPERLPVVARTAGRWVRRMRSWVSDWTSEMEEDLDVGDLRREVDGLRRELDQARQQITVAPREVKDDIDTVQSETREAVDDIESGGREVMDDIERGDRTNAADGVNDLAARADNDDPEEGNVPEADTEMASDEAACDRDGASVPGSDGQRPSLFGDEDGLDAYAVEDAFRSADDDLAEYGDREPFSVERARAEQARRNRESQL